MGHEDGTLLRHAETVERRYGFQQDIGTVMRSGINGACGWEEGMFQVLMVAWVRLD